MIDEYDMPDFDKDRAAAVSWAKELLTRDDVVILDTETTGLDWRAEIVQIAIIDMHGTVLLDTLVQPVGVIPAQASKIHGITLKTVENAPLWGAVREQVQLIIKDKIVMIYNSEYDTRVMRQSDQALGIDEPLQARGWNCVMQQYSAFVGDWNDYHGNYRWQRLPGGDHSALGDCRATLEIIKKMAGI